MACLISSIQCGMKETERAELRKMKARAVEDLQRELPAMLAGYSEIWKTDPRIRTYVTDVAAHPDDHNFYELLAVLRFIRHAAVYRWSRTRARLFIRVYEALKFSGTNARQRYKLTPVQTFFFANVYGMIRPDGRRLYRLVYLFVPRKFAKTTSAAGMAIFDLLFGDNNAQAYVGANSYNQAKICFNEVRATLRGLDSRERHLRINREQVFFTDGSRDSLIACLASNPKTLDGLNASLAILDEYAQARDTASKNGADLKNVLTSSMGTRKEPLTVVITTASDVTDGPCARELAGIKAVLRGEVVNDSVFALLFEPDADDEESDPHTWRKVQPHLGVTVQPDYYEFEWADAQLSAENMMNFRTKMLNIFAVKETAAWISADLATKHSAPMKLEQFSGRPDAMCAFDLSESGDLSAVSLGVYSAEDKCFRFLTAYFFPEGALNGHPNAQLYRIWAERGHLILTPGPVIDYRFIVDHILSANRFVRILQIGYDSWKAAEPVNMLSAAGAGNVLKPVKQTYGTFTAPVQSFEHGIKTDHIWIDDNPINAYCFGNAVLDQDNLENCKPIKRAQTRRIDGVITMLMCMRLFIDFER